MSNVKTKWHGEAVQRAIMLRSRKRLNRAAITLVNYLKRKVSIANAPRKKTKRGYTGKGPSSPGEYPHKLSGHLRRNITHDMEQFGDTVQARVGTNVLYGKYLETGTRKGMKPRPWLMRGLMEIKTKLNSILGRK